MLKCITIKAMTKHADDGMFTENLQLLRVDNWKSSRRSLPSLYCKYLRVSSGIRVSYVSAIGL